MRQLFVLLLIGATLVGRVASARDVVVHFAPLRPGLLHAARTLRVNRELAKLHPDATVLTIDPLLSSGNSEASFAANGEIMRAYLERELTEHPGPIRAIVFQNDVFVHEGELLVMPFGSVSKTGDDLHLRHAFGPMVGHARKNAALVFLNENSLGGRLSEAMDLSRTLMLSLGIDSGSAFGLSNGRHWPIADFPLWKNHVRGQVRTTGLNSGRFFEFFDETPRSRRLSLGLDDEVIFGCAMELEPTP